MNGSPLHETDEERHKLLANLICRTAHPTACIQAFLSVTNLRQAEN
jgi:hypothetical protein